MRRNKSIFQFGCVFTATFILAGFRSAFVIAVSGEVQRIQATAPSASPSPAPETSPQTPPPEPERPPTAEEIKAANDRLVFDRALVDAAVLLTDLENFRRGKSKTPVSLSAFRSLEIRLNAVADADPSNIQARDMARSMQMAQFQLLQPSVAVAAAADRQLYAGAMSEKMRDQQIEVSVNGGDARIVRFMSPRMTRDMGKQLLDSAKIAEQAKRLEFDTIVFTNGRRSWRFDPGRNRYR